MPEAKNLVFNYKEVAEALVRHAGLDEGLWGIYFEFKLAGANIGEEGHLIPTAFVLVSQLGLQKFDEPNNLTVDASVMTKKVSPRRKRPAKKGNRKA